jgi:MFS family permease
MSMFALMPLLFSIPLGRLIDRVGTRRPIAVGCAAQVAGLLVAATWSGVWALGIGATLVGAGHMTLLIAMTSAAGAIGDGSRRVAIFNRLTLVYSVGVMAGPLMAGFALDAAGPRAPFLLLAAAQAAALGWIAAKPTLLPDARSDKPQGHGNPLELLRHPLMRRVLVISTLSPVCWELYYIFMPIYGSEIGLSASTIGAIMGAFAGAIVVMRVFMTKLQNRFGSWSLLGISLLGSALAIAAMPFTGQAAPLAAVSMVFGVMVSLAYPLQMLLLYDAAPEGRKGEATGIRQTLMYAIALAAPASLATLSAAVGFPPVMLAVAAVLGSGGGFAWRVGRGEARRAA